MESLFTFDDGKEILKGKTYTGNNGAEIVFYAIWEHAFAGHFLSYKARHDDMDNGRWANGDITPNSAYYWIQWE